MLVSQRPLLLYSLLSLALIGVRGARLADGNNPNSGMMMPRGGFNEQKPPSLDELLAQPKPMALTHPESHLKTRILNKRMAAGLKVVHDGKEIKPAHSGVHQDYSFLEHHEDQAILHAKPMRIHGFDMDDPRVPFAGTLSDFDTKKLYDAWRQMDKATHAEQRGDHAIALNHYIKAKKIYEDLDGTWSQEYAKLCHFMAGAYYRSGKPQESYEILKVGMEFYEKNDLEDDDEYEAMEDEMDALMAKREKAGDL
jgi:hypothetical protein|eukprot:Stramenopile-MAST_4_protein_4671